MLFRDNDFLIYDTILGLRGDDLSTESLKAMDDEWSIMVDCYTKTQSLIPAMIDYPEKGSINLPSFYQSVFVYGKNMIPKAMGMIKWSGMTEEMAKILVQIGINIQTRTARQSILSDISVYLVDSPEVQTAYGMQRSKSTFDHGDTLAQKEPTDPLYYQLPSDFVISGIIESENVPMPQLTQICDPYPNNLYRSWDIKRILEAPVERRATEIARAVNRLTDAGFKFDTDAKVLANSFKIIPSEYVFGDPLNDDLEIQENEQNFYDNFIEFIKHHIDIFNREVMTTSTLEEIQRKNEEDFNVGNLPKRLEMYLKELLYVITRYHYHHVGTFMIADNLFKDPDVNDNEEDERMNIGYTDERRESEPPEVIKGYIDLSSKTYTAKVWADAIVRLSRWGERKQAKLILGKDNPNEVDLLTMSMKTTTLNLAKLEKVVDEKGRCFFINGIAPAVFFEDGFGSETPAVLAIYESYKNPGNQEVIENQFSSISTQELIQEYQNGNHFISGLEFNGTEFYTESDAVRYLPELKPNDVSRLKSYISNSLIELCHKHQITKVNGMGYTLITRDNLMSFTVVMDDSFDPVSYLATFSAPERMQGLYGFWLSNFDKTAKELEADDFIEYLNDYLALVSPQFIANLAGLVESKVDASAYAASRVFKDLPETNEVEEIAEPVDVMIEEKGDETMHRLFKGNVEDLVFTKIVNIKAPKNEMPVRFVGAYAKNSAGTLVFASPKDKVKIDPLQVPATFANVGPYLLGAAVGAFSNTSLTKAPEVISETTLEEMYNSYWGL